MTQQQKIVHTMLLYALCKVTSGECAFLINQLKQKPKQDFNNMVGSVDKFVNSIEKTFTPEELAISDEIVDAIHGVMKELKGSVVVD